MALTPGSRVAATITRLIGEGGGDYGEFEPEKIFLPRPGNVLWRRSAIEDLLKVVVRVVSSVCFSKVVPLGFHYRSFLFFLDLQWVSQLFFWQFQFSCWFLLFFAILGCCVLSMLVLRLWRCPAVYLVGLIEIGWFPLVTSSFWANDSCALVKDGRFVVGAPGQAPLCGWSSRRSPKTVLFLFLPPR